MAKDLRPSERDPNWRRRPRVWTPSRLGELETRLMNGESDSTIAKYLKCSATSVKLARKRHQFPKRSDFAFSAREAAVRLGIPDSSPVLSWIRHGWLKATKGPPTGKNRQHWIATEALYDFLANPAHWHRWDQDRVADSECRKWIAGIKPERFLTVGEIMNGLHVSQGAVNQWIQKGILPAVKHGPNWLIRASALVGFVIPGERPVHRTFGKQRTWTAAEDARLMALLGDVAAALDRPVGGLAQRALRILRGRRGNR